jgi:5'-nucleotidase
MSFRNALFILGVTACRTAAPSSTSEFKTAPPIHITLVGTNDLHGFVMAQDELVGTAKARAGGLAAFASYIKILRTENPQGLVLVDAGDLFQGTLISNLSEGSVVVDAYNLLGYDAAAVGNHEFDYGPVGPEALAKEPSMDSLGALKARVAQAKFSFLAANVYERDSAKHPTWLGNDGTKLIERAGVKIGLIGLATPSTPSVTIAANITSLRFEPLVAEATQAAARLRSQGAEVVIAVLHAGARCAEAKNARDTHSCDADSAEIFAMLNKLPPGTLDAAVAGHTHGLMGHFINGVAVIESWAQGRSFGVVNFVVDSRTRRIVADKTSIEPAIEICETFTQTSQSCSSEKTKGTPEPLVPATFRGQPIVPDTQMLELLEPAQKRVDMVQQRRLGRDVPQRLERRYEDEGALGSVLADALKSITGADAVVLGPGGLRADLEAGPLTYGAVYEILPFDNQIAVLTLTGTELERVMQALYTSRKGMIQVAGMQLTVSKCATNRLRSLLVNGKPIEPARTYRLATTDFLARGGEGLGPTLRTIDPKHIDLGDMRPKNLREALVALWETQAQPLVAPAKGRSTLVDGPCP